MKKRLSIIFVLASVFILIAEFLIEHPAAKEGEWWTRISFFYAFFGFIGCLIIVAIAKLIGRFWLLKDEDYYNER